MGADHVVIEHVPVDAVDHLPRCDVLVDVYILVFQAAEKAFCANVAYSAQNKHLDRFRLNTLTASN